MELSCRDIIVPTSCVVCGPEAGVEEQEGGPSMDPPRRPPAPLRVRNVTGEAATSFWALGCLHSSGAGQGSRSLLARMVSHLSLCQVCDSKP